MNDRIHIERSAMWAALCVCAVLLWQSLTVHFNYGGNWTALFCTGTTLGIPACLSGEHLYQFPGTAGFDGQYYHYIAHDPLLRDPELRTHIDAPRYRYRRILLPGLAWSLAFGQARWIDTAYVAVTLLSIGLGVFWSSGLCLRFGAHPAYGMLFVLLPAVLVSIDRLVTDVLLATLAVGFVLYSTRPSWRLILVLAVAPLVRETGFALLAGYCGYLLIERRWKAALGCSFTSIPALLWYFYVHTHTTAYGSIGTAPALSTLAAAITKPIGYPPGVPLVSVLRTADMAVTVGLVFAFVLAIILIARRCFLPECLAALCFLLLGALFLPQHVYDSGRIFTPLLVFLAVQGLRRKSVIWCIPWFLEIPRIGMQMAPQILGVIRGLAHR